MAFLQDDDTLRLYVEESREYLGDLEADLLRMEECGAAIDEELVNRVFRAAHTIKGGAGFFGLTTIQQLAHKVENILDMVRSRELVPNPEIINLLLIAFDRLRELINDIEHSNEQDVSDHVAGLVALAEGNLPPAQKASVEHEIDVPDAHGRTGLTVTEFDLRHAAKAGEYLYVVAYDLLDDIHRKGKTPFDLVRGLTGCGRIMQVSLDLAAPGDLDDELTGQLPLRVLYASVLEPSLAPDLFEVPEDQITVVTEALLDDQPVAAAPAAVAPEPEPEPELAPPPPVVADPVPPPVEAAAGPAEPAAATSSAKSAPTETSLRVNVEVLEALMNLAGELVLSRNQLVEAIASGDSQALAVGGQRLNLVTSELQAAIMQTRMQQIGLVLNKFPRVVRDMARQLGKEIRLELEGTEVELDKTLVEGLNDPLTHMVRNAVDHGIEPAAVRRAAGKPASGLVKLSAWHEAGQVIIEIRDDGKGLDTARIAASAISKGLLTEAQVRGMTEQERLQLIFLPGLSTAAAITDVSGRGVGMDVVKTNLDKLGGHVEIESVIGQGARFRIKLPLTLAIIPSLLVAVGGERFAIPQTNVGELIRIPAAAVRERIEPVGDRPVLRLRGELVPLLSLPEVLGLEPTSADEHGLGSLHLGSGEVANRDLNVVLVSAGLVSYGLVVESLHDTQEIVVKPLGRHLKGLREYAGATIMGDGQVALILDVAGMAAKAGLSSATLQREVASEAVAEAEGENTALLLFRNGPDEPCAVPLGLVSRLERIDSSVIEIVGGQRVMPYRGGSLPLVELSDAARVGGLGEPGERVVVLFEAGGREVGLLANAPVDALDIAAAIDSETLKQPGISGSFLYDGQTTMLVDLFDVLGAVYPDWRPAAGSRGSRGRTVLLAEDSDFFREQVRRYLEAEGYSVVEAVDGQEAWELLAEHGAEIEAVVTDIEMPRMDGYGLTRAIRDSQQWRHLPIIALTSLAGDEDIARGKAAGITDYQVKLDRDRLLDGLRTLFGETSATAAAA